VPAGGLGMLGSSVGGAPQKVGERGKGDGVRGGGQGCGGLLAVEQTRTGSTISHQVARHLH